MSSCAFSSRGFNAGCRGACVDSANAVLRVGLPVSSPARIGRCFSGELFGVLDFPRQRDGLLCIPFGGVDDTGSNRAGGNSGSCGCRRDKTPVRGEVRVRGTNGNDSSSSSGPRGGNGRGFGRGDLVDPSCNEARDAGPAVAVGGSARSSVSSLSLSSSPGSLAATRSAGALDASGGANIPPLLYVGCATCCLRSSI